MIRYNGSLKSNRKEVYKKIRSAYEDDIKYSEIKKSDQQIPKEDLIAIKNRIRTQIIKERRKRITKICVISFIVSILIYFLGDFLLDYFSKFEF